jgi:hypothetical protein
MEQLETQDLRTWIRLSMWLVVFVESSALQKQPTA